jgi:type IV pilus assembly protein PilZ
MGLAPAAFAPAWLLTGGSPLQTAALLEDDNFNESSKLRDQLSLLSTDQVEVHAVAEAWSKAGLELALTWITRELHRQIRLRLAPGVSTSVTDPDAGILHNAWSQLTVRRLFEQYETAERLESVGVGHQYGTGAASNAARIPGESRIAVSKPGLLTLTIKDKSALYLAYMPFIKNGGLFIPTNSSYKLGDEVFMLLNVMGEEEKIPVAGRVIWITPKGAQGKRTAGIGVQFSEQDQGKRRSGSKTISRARSAADKPTQRSSKATGYACRPVRSAHPSTRTFENRARSR